MKSAVYVGPPHGEVSPQNQSTRVLKSGGARKEQLPLLLPLVTPCISLLQLPYKQSQTGRLAQQKLEVGSSKIKVAAKLGFPDYG